MNKIYLYLSFSSSLSCFSSSSFLFAHLYFAAELIFPSSFFFFENQEIFITKNSQDGQDVKTVHVLGKQD